MRIRRKPWARPELAEWENCIDVPAENRGKWHSVFKNDAPLMIELGCGKGGFISKLAVAHPETNFIAVDIKSEMLGLAMRNIKREYAEANREVDNVYIFSQEIMLINKVFSSKDVCDRIYINFCNPWPKTHDHKKRLTHNNQLMQYREFLKDGGEIRFKTDNDDLFLSSKRYFAECGFELTYVTEDLHNSGFDDNIETEHEKMFSEQGIPIKFLIAKKLTINHSEKVVNEVEKTVSRPENEADKPENMNEN
ncbi:MAG: tRNA (guanosine(46)-N7)-methyltransferase TrmB [Oscillospiraceae bacterium]|nr:tRNA (guanosine(46)-N7)-methyltransferase TrmB [Oscillospiraceae bacterium]